MTSKISKTPCVRLAAGLQCLHNGEHSSPEARAVDVRPSHRTGVHGGSLRWPSAGEAPRVLVVRLEPAGYMLALVRALRVAWPGRVDAIFVSPSITQHWELDQVREDVALLPSGSVRSVSRLWDHIAATRPRLIHVAGWGAPQTAAAILFGKARKVPVVVDLDTWQGSPSLLRSAAKRIVLPYLFRRVAHFTPGGQPQAAYLRRHGVPDEKITPVNMTVDVAGIADLIGRRGLEARTTFREQHGLSPDAVVALFVGRLVEVKGIDTVLSAWARVRDRYDGACLVVVGDGDMRDVARVAAERDPSIRLIGHLPTNDVWRAYAAADFLVGASRAEPWGLVVNEAMSANLPVVVTDAYGCARDLVRHGETGLIVPSNDSAALAGAVETLIADGKFRRAMGTNARSLISAWTIEAQANNIGCVWERLLSQRHGEAT